MTAKYDELARPHPSNPNQTASEYWIRRRTWERDTGLTQQEVRADLATHLHKTGVLHMEVKAKDHICDMHADLVKALADRDAVAEAIRSLIQGYVNLLETGRDRIVEGGGQCDPVDVMERSDPWLRNARAALARVKEEA